MNVFIILKTQIITGLLSPGNMNNFNKFKIAVMVAATGKYTDFIPNLSNKLKIHCKIDYDLIVHTDNKDDSKLKNVDKIYYTKRLGFPYDSIHRYYNICHTNLNEYTHVIHVDADVDIIKDIPMYAFKDYVIGFRISPYANMESAFENRKESMAYVAPSQREYYIRGGLLIGSTKSMRKLACKCDKMYRTDQKNNIMAKHHDESYLNKYLTSIGGSKKLADFEYYFFSRPGEITPNTVFVALDKDHSIYQKPVKN